MSILLSLLSVSEWCIFPVPWLFSPYETAPKCTSEHLASLDDLKTRNCHRYKSRGVICVITAFLKSACSVPRPYNRDLDRLGTLIVTYAHHRLSLALMKRRNGASTPTTRLVSQRSSAEPAVTLFKLEDPDDDSSSAPGSSAVRRSKRVKVEVVETEEMVNADSAADGELPIPITDSEGLTSKGKRARSSSRSGRARSTSPRKPKTIKQALEKPHPAPVRWRETYDAIKEMRSRFPAPVDTMGCDTAKWKETDPRVRDEETFSYAPS